MTRSGLIDFLRGWAIWGVIQIHVLLLVPRNNNKEAALTTFALWGDLLVRFAVPFFIGILGYMTYTKYMRIEQWGRFYKDKLLLIGLPFLLWSYVYTKTPDIFSDYRDYVQTDLQGILFGYAEIHLYFMIAYFGFLALTPLVVGMLQVVPPKLHPLIAWALMLLHWVVLYQVEADVFAQRYDTLYIQTQSRLPLHWFGYYAAGLLLASVRTQLLAWIQRHLSWLRTAGFVLIPLYVWLIASMVSARVYLYIYHTPVLMVLSGLAWLLLSWLYARIGRRITLIRWVELLGKHSFAVYLSHVLWIIAGWRLAEAFRLELPLAIAVTWCAAVVGSLLYIPLHSAWVAMVTKLMK